MIQEIRKKLYLAMDGANASAMRKKGVDYKLNFGVPIVTLRKMAVQYAPDKELANTLWKEDTRELKILATLIQDPESFSEADEWVCNIRNIELAEQACMNLFCKLHNAGELAKKWVQSDKLYIRISGFILYTRLFRLGFQLNNDSETYFHAVFHALGEESLLLKNAALSSMKRLGRQSAVNAKDILARCSSGLLQPEEQKAIYDDLIFEFDYYS